MRNIVFLVALLASSVAFAQDFGVLAKEHVVNLPQDQAKWHISVVGDGKDARYQEVLGWFDNTQKMKSLKTSAHFHPVTTDSAVYKERYATNEGSAKITALPCVRVQNAEGVIAYQVCGNQIPMTAEGLYAAISDAVNYATNGTGDRKEILPWRRNHSNPTPQPAPEPTPEPAPEPIIPDTPDTPAVEPDSSNSTIIGIAACIAGLVVGIGIGQWKKLQDKIAQKAKS
jgi:hypothetical protein